MPRENPVAPGRAAGAALAALGCLLLAIHLRHAAEEVGKNVPAVVYGAVLPSLVALVLFVGAGWTARQEWRDVSPWRFVAWSLGGLAVATLLSGLHLRYQVAEGVVPEDQQYVLAMFATYGAAVGLLVGRYDFSIRTAQASVARERQRLDEFASIVSHDLRNPLGVARGYTELARDQGDLELLDRVAAAHDRMDAILRDTLSLARTGEDAMNPGPVELDTTARAAWDMVETGQAVLDVDTGRTVVADRTRLQALLENLFRNAAQHNEGALRVRVGALDDGFFVEDDGEGIVRERRERVFEAGYTTGDGTGLGLAIVRAAADAHDWSHVLTESPTGGARFEFGDVEEG